MGYSTLASPLLPQMLDDGFISEVELVTAGGVSIVVNVYGNPKQGDYLALYWDGHFVSDLFLTSKNIDSAFPWASIVPEPLVTNGKHHAWFTAIDSYQNSSKSGISTAIVKRKHAGVLPPPSFPDAVENVIDNASVILNLGSHIHIPNTSDEFVKGANIEVYWAGFNEKNGFVSESVTIISHIITDSDIESGANVLVEPPFITAIDQGSAWASYAISPPLSLTQTISESASVKIDMDTMVQYPALLIPENNEGWIGCENVSDGVIVTVLGNPLFLTGSQITVYWQGYTLNGDIISNAVYEETHTLTEEEAKAGFDVQIPVTAMTPIQLGYAQLWYQVTEPSAIGISDYTYINIDNVHCAPLPPPVFNSAEEDNTIDREEVNNSDGTIMTIFWDNMQEGDNITTYWVGYTTTPDSPVPGSPWNTSRDVTAEDIAQGFAEFHVPADNIRIIGNGKALGYYKVLLASGGIAVSSNTEVYVMQANGDNATIGVIGIRKDNAKANGIDVNTVFATVKSDNILLPGQYVIFSTSNGATITSPVMTDENGVAETTLTNTVEGTAKTTAIINNSYLSTDVNFSESDMNDPESQVNFLGILKNNAEGNGIEENSVSALVIGKDGKQLSNQSVMFESDNGAIINSPIISDVYGFATTTLTNIVAGVSSITASVNNSTQTIDVMFTNSDDAIITDIDIKTNYAESDNISVDEIIVRVIGTNEKPLYGQSVIFSTDNEATVQSPKITDSDGEAITTITSPYTGNVKVIASVNGIGKSIYVDFKNIINAEIGVLGINNNNAKADGIDKNIVGVVIVGNDGLLSGQSVVFQTDNELVIDSPVMTDEAGYASSSITSNTPGKFTVIATINDSHKTIDINFI
ncbi:Ig-like domain-containing protein [Serratia rhizosphaerae]|uniref:Big-1 domain-containing protein n=1 Tax=Serratia rhizosphaerae TaxID=2597702 RepID=A0ABX6GP11_9GAMM|nr:Ig-like domain-containing protein [Serratia rhizosphaerae]QHA88020.1 hypothetical protein FO014_14245 [Serratia rhizosphaerae]